MEKIRKRLIREKAVIAIYQYELIGTTEDEIEEYLKSDKKLEKDEYQYCLEFILKIIENIDIYRERIISCLKTGWTIDRLSKMELAILIVGVHELLEGGNKTVIINEAIEASKKYCDDQSYKYINGVLNKLS